MFDASQVALSRRAAFRRTFAAVLDATRRCREEGAVLVLVEPSSGRAEVQAAFDEIDEKLHLSGIDLRLAVDCDGLLNAILEPLAATVKPAPASRRHPDVAPSPRV